MEVVYGRWDRRAETDVDPPSPVGWSGGAARYRGSCVWDDFVDGAKKGEFDF